MNVRNSKIAASPEDGLDSKIYPDDVGNSDQKPSLRKEILFAIKDTADRSSIHGFPNFAAASVNWFAKIVWALCVGCSWGYLIFQINNSILLYNSYSVVSSTSIVYEAPTDFFGKILLT